jgi:hypothetical protein
MNTGTALPSRASSAKPKDSLAEVVSDRVDAHFGAHTRAIEESIRTKIEDVQLGLLDNFFRRIQTSYAGRIAALEETARVNNEALRDIQGHSERAEDDLQRLAAGIRRLIGESPPSSDIS